MEFAILAVLLVLAIPIGIVTLFVQMGGVKRRLEQAEARLVAAQARIEALESPRPAAAPAAARTAAQAQATAPAPAPTAERTAPPETRSAEPPAPAGMPPETAPEIPPAIAAETPLPPPVPRAPDLLERFGAWLRENWVYAISGVSLALAGIFLVQYGAERGLLPPGLRVLAALAFGAALVGAGEWVRRRHGDGEGVATAYLPSLLSGAGIVSGFAAIVAARQMYGLIGPEATFAGLVAIATAAVILGWLHGPLLAALGLTGAVAAPFLVGGASDAVDWLYAYFLLVAALGLAVDALRRWAWVSVLGVALPLAAGFLLSLGGGSGAGLMLMAAALVPLAIAIPARGLIPDQQGPSLTDALLIHNARIRPGFPVLLAAGTTLAATALIFTGQAWDMPLLPFVLLAALTILLALWTGRAGGIQDLSLIPAAAFLLRIGTEAQTAGPLISAFATPPAPEQAADPAATWIVALATAMTVALALRGLRGAALPLVMSAAAALTAPLAVLVLALAWPVAAILGPYPWALHVIALAAVMVALALQHARADAPDLRRFAHFTLSALALIGLALFTLLSAAALSLALAVLVVVAAALDRRLSLPEMGWAVQAGILLLGWRMAVDPGLLWAFDAALPATILAYLGPAAGMAAVLWLMRGMARAGVTAFAESGLALALVLLADVLVLRWLAGGDWLSLPEEHWSVTLLALPWVMMSLVQLWRTKLGGAMARLRLALAALSGLIGGLGLLAATLPLNPLLTGDGVRGPLLADSLMVAYLVPALLLGAAAWRMPHLHPRLRQSLGAAGVALAALWLLLEIRRFWRGDDLSVPGTSQPELYSYTVALLVLGVALLWQAIARRSGLLRRIAMGVIGLTVAKVFLIDASGLSGLMRVFSFLALGLSLAGLAWLNRWAGMRAQDGLRTG
ncbi:MAG: membrane protein [Rhodobacter sp. CACIA14H1]|nr:MAG: membrane protein [Rhodobacter sp. CACIA14H1]